MSDSKKKALVVDDAPLVAESVAMILRKAGFEAIIAPDGSAAWEQAQALKPDLLITGVLIPQFRGTELAVRVRHLVPSCRVILMSTQAETAESISSLLDAATAQGCRFEFLGKPFAPEELLDMLRCRP